MTETRAEPTIKTRRTVVLDQHNRKVPSRCAVREFGGDMNIPKIRVLLTYPVRVVNADEYFEELAQYTAKRQALIVSALPADYRRALTRTSAFTAWVKRTWKAVEPLWTKMCEYKIYRSEENGTWYWEHKRGEVQTGFPTRDAAGQAAIHRQVDLMKG